jgi:serine/threonine-protein kinase
MTTERWRRIEELVLSALEFDSAQREEFLQGACAGDTALRAEVESFLAVQSEAQDFISSPAVAYAIGYLPREETVEQMTDHRLGPYKILRELGHGGMGVVYLAAREDDQFRQNVAIKLIKRGLDTDDILRRFRNERQILASLNHPHIARLHDGGTSDDGRPYFVMEYVEGLPLLQYCNSQNLSIHQRLQLFQKICAAVQHAHQNLVIHRDLKPSNILVTHEGDVKLLDFGVAKLLDSDLTDGVIDQTRAAQRVMTPEYASPEQIRGEHVTTATDVYSLGVLLYELLTGAKPYKLKDTTPEELSRAICEEEPARPSAVGRHTDAEMARRAKLTTEPSSLSPSAPAPASSVSIRQISSCPLPFSPSQLRGDLDNIVLMALRKDPQRRYESAAAFSADIQRHLNGLSVIARKDTFKYRTSKYVRRNRLAVTAAAIILLSLLAGVVTTFWQARAAARQAQAAQRERIKAESINAVLEQMLNYSNPVFNSPGNKGRETTMTDMLDETAKRLEGKEFANQPEVKAELERIISSSYYGQGRYDLGREHLREYGLLERALYGENHPRALTASADWAALLFNKGEMIEAEGLYRKVLPPMRVEQQRGNIKTAFLMDALTNFAYLRRTQGDPKEAEALFREALALGPQVPAELRYSMGVTRSTLASTLADQGEFDEAIQTARAAVAESRQQADKGAGLGFSLTVLGGFLVEQGNFAEADAALSEAETILRKLLHPSHLWLGDNLRNQSLSYYRQDRFAEAQKKVDETLKIYLESFGVHYDNYPTALITKALILNKTGRSKEAEVVLREAVKLRTESLPKDHFWVAVANDALGECLTNQKRFAEAEPLLIESYATLKSRLGPTDPRTAEAFRRLGTLYDSWGKPEQAARYRSD